MPLYRKYRPAKFSDVVGQESVVKTLSNAIELNKVAHAYLFTGPRGTGKTSLARIFAKSLNCQNGSTLEPCGVCASCTDIATGSAIDVIEIDAASNRKVDDARNLLEKVQFVPMMSKYKVYIIDEVHMLTTEAFNTLLKTLEEPPENLVFILATTESHKVLNTIISRCQRFDFRRIKYNQIIDRLKYIAEVEGLKFNEKAISIIARRSSGGLRDALALLDQASLIIPENNEITEKEILNLLGNMKEDILYNLVNAVINRNTADLLSLLNEILDAGSEPVVIMRELMNYFRNLLIVKSSNNCEEIISFVDISPEIYSEIKKQASTLEIIEITQIIEKIAECEKTLKNSSNQSLWLETTLIGITHRHEINSVKLLEERISKMEEYLKEDIRPIPAKTENKIDFIPPKPQEVVKSAPAPVQEAPTPVLQSESVKEPEKTQVKQVVSGNIIQNWQTMLENIESIPSRMFFFNLSKPIELSAQKIVITFAVESFVKQAQDKSKFAPLEKAAEKFFGTLPQIVIRTALPDDNKIANTVSAEPTITKVQKTQPAEPVQRIESEKTSSSTATMEAPVKESKPQIKEKANENDETVITPVNIPEQAKMVMDLFKGKIIE